MPGNAALSKGAIWVLWLAVFADLFGFGMVIADFQIRAEELVPPNWPVGAVIGVVLASTFVVQTLVSPRWGAFSDRVGRKPVLLACSVLSALGMLTYGLANTVPLLLLSRVLSGLGGANVAIAQAAVTDHTLGIERLKAMGRLTAAISAGLILGPPVGGFLGERFGHEVVGWVGGGISLLGAAAIALYFPKLPVKPRDPTHPSHPGSLRLLREYPHLARLALVATVAWFSLAMLEGTFGRLIKRLYGFGSAEFGMLFGFESLVSVLVQALGLAWLAAKVRQDWLLRSAFVLQGIGLALNPVAVYLAGPALAWLFVASAVYALGAGVANPTVNTACSELVPEERHGELFGLLQGARSVGFVLGPILGGSFFDRFPPGPFYLAGGVCVAAALLIPRIQSEPALAKKPA
jgi:MFS family permease